MNAGHTIAGRYRLESVLGEGGQATVHRATDLHGGRSVAVKILDGQLARDPTMLARVAREQQAMQALAGTNIVEFIDLCAEPDGRLCLVMELLEGRNLESRLKEVERAKAFLPVSETVAIMQPVVDTLERAHAVGIVHRDLKPSNIFLLSERLGGGTRLLDFGLANLSTADPLTRAGVIMGSPSYIAPESWAGVPGRTGVRADIYSLGVLLFRMLGARMPFIGSSLLEKMRNATSSERPSLHEIRPELPPQVDFWVERALAVDPRDRFASVAACFGELLWALKLAPHPSRQRRTRISQEHALQVRSWLDAEPSPASSLPPLSIEPVPLDSDVPLEDEQAPSSSELPYLSVEPLPLSDRPSVAATPHAKRAAERRGQRRLPPIPQPPRLPEQEISSSFIQGNTGARHAPSVLPEQSGVRTNVSDEWEAPTACHAPGTGRSK